MHQSVDKQNSESVANYHDCACPGSKTLMYSEIPLFRPPKIKTFYLLKSYFESLSYSFLHFLPQVYIWLETTFGTVQKWS